MVSRRRTLRVAAAGLASFAGCAGSAPSDSGSPTPESTPTLTPPPTDTDGTDAPPDSTTRTTSRPAEVADPPEWTPSWRLDVGGGIYGFDPEDGVLYAVAGSEGGSSAVVAIDPAERDVAWRTELDGEPVEGSHAEPNDDDLWGVTVENGRVYAVSGTADSYGWTAVRALDRDTGDRRWSFRKERRLAVRGVDDGRVFAAGLEFFEPEHSHDTPREPLATVLYAIDVETGTARWSRTFVAVEDVAVGSGAVYVVADDRLVALDYDGEVRFAFERGGPGKGVHVASDRVYYTTGSDRDRATIHGLTASGDRDWTRSLPVSEFALAGNRLYAGGAAVAALDPDGTVAWRDDTWGRSLLFGPDEETLFARAGRGADRVSAYATGDGRKRWVFNPPSNDAWPAAATDDAAVVQAITAEDADDPFTTLYAVDTATGTPTAAFESGGSAATLDGTLFVGGDSTVLAFDP